MSTLAATTATRTTPENVPTPAPARSGFRPDIQGLRAIAVGMVVIYHLFPAALPGGFAGVDVFFVISGYLITGHLWRGYAETGKVSLVGFWGRRARRLVPAAVLVLLVTWGVSRLVIPATRLADTAQQVLASALYFQNWQLAHDAVDYLKSNEAASPVQHFWSLSVEEQFYLVWPLLFVLAALAAAGLARARRNGAGPGAGTGPDTWRTRRAAVGVLTTALVAGSLAYSVWDTQHDPAAAYFATTTRMWELGAGGLLALAPARAAGWLAGRRWLAWTGLAAVAASAFVLNGAMPFPGDLALLPVLGAVAIIAGGHAGPDADWPGGGRFPARRLLAARPMVFAGGISYSLYLWHYPVINLFTAWRGQPPGLAAGLALLAVSVVLAWLSKTFVEDPVRLARALRGHGWRSVSVALAAAVPVALAAAYIASEPPPWNGRLGPGYPGAAALASANGRAAPVSHGKPVLPPPAQATAPSYWTHCLDHQSAATPAPCVFGDTTHPTMTVALVGDSIAGNWWEALNVIAKQKHWKLVTELHGSCAWSATPALAPGTGGTYSACTAWGHAVLHDLLTTVRPQLVITSSDPAENAVGYPRNSARSRAAIGAGEAAYWKQLRARHVRVAAIRETPDPGIDAPACVWQYGSQNSRCDAPKASAIAPGPPSATAARMTGAPVIGMNDLICDARSCPAVVGNVLVYFDGHHFTQAYSQTLAPFLERRLLASGAVPGR